MWEWCLDGYDEGYYARSPRLDPVAEPAEVLFRVHRGGGFYDPASVARASHRSYVTPTMRSFELGLRPARAIDGSAAPGR